MDDACVADQYIYVRQCFHGGFYGGGVCYIAADGGGAGLGGHGPGSIVILLVQEVYPVTPGGKQTDGGGTNAPGSAGDQYG
jgi:hypothetical protein